MEVFNLNIIPGAVAPIIHASQYDEDREFRANLFEGDQVFELTGAETISVNVRKPDGNVVTAAVVNTGSNYVEFSTTLQMTACAGANLCQLRIEDSPRKIGSLNFILAVERDPLEGGIQSASEIDNLETQVAGMVAVEVANQYDSANVIFDNTPTAGHGVGYAVTSEGVKTELDTLSAAIAGKVDQANFDATNLPIQSGSATNTKDYIDSGLSGKADTSSLNDKQNKNVLNIVKTYNSGSSIDALQDIITTYGKVSMIFAFSVAGVGQYFGMLTFYNDNLGGGYFINQGGRFWAIVYSAGTFTLTEKT